MIRFLLIFIAAFMIHVEIVKACDPATTICEITEGDESFQDFLDNQD